MYSTGGVTTKSGTGESDLQPELSLEELVQRTKPAIVLLKTLEKSGTGFFVTETGVIATNAHVARGEEFLRATLPEGDELEVKVVYVDDELDIALAKAEGKDFPHLTLADAAIVRQGESVIAIGNPGVAMNFSVTKGIVSAIGKLPEAGPGTWIQTDTPINPGNSGGPLLNKRGEVVGINTLKLVKKGVTGIAFALSASDLIEVLQKFYPSSVPVAQRLSSSGGEEERRTGVSTEESTGTIRINEPEGADISVDGVAIGQVPATLSLAAGSHRVVIDDHKHATWTKRIVVLKDSQVTLKPDFGPPTR